MTPMIFFRLVIKVFGLYAFINSFYTFIPNIPYIIDLGYHLSLLGIPFLHFLIAYLFLFQTDRIIRILRLERGFENTTISIAKPDGNDILNVAVIVIGGLLLVNNIAQFIHYCYLAFKKEVSANGLDETSGYLLDEPLDHTWWFISGANTITGFILITNYSRIAKWLKTHNT
ncbi:hypothetical protein [Ascidiimonas aurantiaca]|uniref:hypothetical protein n=1 Tax=Ascidiimonas aurantiaca TaxID=1685432 RepID=UPI0030ED4550